MKRKFGLWAITALVALGAGSAGAAIQIVVGGQLIGASNVDVGGNLYDVEFLDGTCIGLYGGCDGSVDFIFSSEAEAKSASQALLDQVFFDGVDGPFDSSPDLTQGCSFPAVCQSFTPYAVAGATVSIAIANNRDFELGDFVSTTLEAANHDTVVNTPRNYAVWTLVPEPSAALLIALGLTGLGWAGRTKHA